MFLKFKKGAVGKSGKKNYIYTNLAASTGILISNKTKLLIASSLLFERGKMESIFRVMWLLWQITQKSYHIIPDMWSNVLRIRLPL